MEDKKKRIYAIALTAFFALAFLILSFGTYFLAVNYGKLREEQSALAEQYYALKLEYDKKTEEFDAQAEQLKEAQDELSKVKGELEALKIQITEIQNKADAYEELLPQYQQLQKENASLKSQYSELEAKYNALLQNPAVNYDMLWELVQMRLPGIVCFGDSLTGGNEGGTEENNQWSYPLELQSLVQSEVFYRIPVARHAWAGQPSSYIMEYAGYTLANNPEETNYIYIIWMGTNGGWSSPAYDSQGNPILDGEGNQVEQEDPQKLIDQIDAILATQKDSAKRYLVIGLTTRTSEQAAELDGALSSKYGSKFVNIRQYLSTSALTDAGITPTADDLTLMAQGKPPASLMKDGTHYMDTGYRLIARYIFNKMTELGYFNTALEKVHQYVK